MDLSDPGTLRRFLDRHGLTAKKGLGQHFLCSAKVVQAILGQLEGFAGVLEIGPGPGALTAPISSTGIRVTAVELDPRMGAALQESAPTAQVVMANALEVDLWELLRGLPEPKAIVSNLPYYITGPLITRFAECRLGFDRAILMMQREVGERILALPGNSDRGSLSVYLQAQFEIEKVCAVPPGAFLPPPKVESLVLQFTPRIREGDWMGLPEVSNWVRKSFAQPRKTLANNLRAAGFERGEVESAMRQVGLDLRARPADLDLRAWKQLAQALIPGELHAFPDDDASAPEV